MAIRNIFTGEERGPSLRTQERMVAEQPVEGYVDRPTYVRAQDRGGSGTPLVATILFWIGMLCEVGGGFVLIGSMAAFTRASQPRSFDEAAAALGGMILAPYALQAMFAGLFIIGFAKIISLLSEIRDRMG